MSAPAVDRDLGKLAPLFRGAVEGALERCVRLGLDAMVNEACRTDALQQMYFAAGTSDARDVLHSWHGYGLAVDVISRSKQWEAGDDWFRQVADVFKEYGCDWGGDWIHFKDLPHMQWGKCKPSPSDEARSLLASGGVEAVWRACGAV